MEEVINNYKVGIYCRLSLDDGTSGESNSIQTQKMILTKYVKENHLELVDVYVDDGYSGLNFNRPSFQRLLNDIESGKINMVVTKDLSRLGRDYIQTGYYTKIYFLDNKVRYVALTDGIDTTKELNDIAPFKNILNDMYAKDLSRKVKIAKRSRANEGLFIGAQVPYGYLRDPHEKGHLIVDDNAKDTIKQIFKWCLEGKGTPAIAKLLNVAKVLSPGQYKAKQGDARFARFAHKDWTYVTVRGILNDMVYCGHMENHKYEVQNYKTKKLVKVPLENHIVVRNTHEAIVSEEDYKMANQLIQARIHPRVHKSENLFKGIVYCAHCGFRMTLTHQKRNHNFISETYKCPTRIRDHDKCPEPNTMLYRQVKGIVQLELRELSKSLNNEEFFQKLIQKKNERMNSKDMTKEINKLQNRLDSIYSLIKNVFENNQQGLLDNDTASRMIKDYQEEQKAIKEKLAKINEEKASNENNQNNYLKLKEEVNKFLSFEELTPIMVNSLIERIEIGYRQGKNRNVTIKYKFINDFSF